MADTATGTQIVSWLSLGLIVLGIIGGVINHKRIRSTCCKHEASLSLDVENTSPKGDTKLEGLKTKPTADENAS